MSTLYSILLCISLAFYVGFASIIFPLSLGTIKLAY